MEDAKLALKGFSLGRAARYAEVAFPAYPMPDQPFRDGFILGYRQKPPLRVMIESAPTEFIEQAALYFAIKLGIGHCRINLTISEFRPSLDQDLVGFCADLGDGFFDIAIDLSDTEELLSIIAHEMFHVKQYVSGELRDVSNGVVYKDVFYPKVNAQLANHYPYERDAVNAEGKLCAQFIRSYFVRAERITT